MHIILAAVFSEAKEAYVARKACDYEASKKKKKIPIKRT